MIDEDHGVPLSGLLLYSLKDDDVRVSSHPDGEHQPRHARKGQRDRDHLHQGVEEDRVDDQPQDGDGAEEAVVEEQEEGDEDQARQAGLEALVEGLLAQRRRDRALADQLQVDRKRADLQELRKVLRLLQREAARDLRAGATVDAVWVVVEVDDGPRDDLPVEDDREGVGLAETRLEPPLGDGPGNRLERGTTLIGEVERDVGLPVLVGVLLGVGDVGAGQLRVVLEDEVPRRRVGGVGVGLVLDHDRPLGDLEDLLIVLRRDRYALAAEQVAPLVLRAGDVLATLLLEQVVLRTGRRADVPAGMHLLLGGQLDRVVVLGRRLLLEVHRRDRLVGGIERDYVRLEVVEVQLRGLADLRRRSRRILDIGQADLNLGGAERGDLGLGHAERVDPLSHDLDRVVDVLGIDDRVLRRRLALVDELGAAAEVEAELRRLRGDDQQGADHHGQDQGDDRDVYAARAHIRGRLLRGEDEQHSAIVVVGREDVGYGLRRQVPLGVNGHALAK